MDDLDPAEEIRRLKKRIERLESGTGQESTSVDRGRWRIGNAEFRVDDDGVFSLVGTFNQSGEFNIYDGGVLRVRPGGGIEVQSGGDITLIDGGEIVIDGPVPLNLRQWSIAGVPQAAIMAGSSQLGMFATGSTSNPNLVITSGGPSRLQFTGDGINVQAPNGTATKYLAVDGDGNLVLASGGTGGGPGGDVFMWPFPLDQVTSEFRTPERPTHDGIDFGIGPSNTEGTPIPCAGDGTIQTILSVNDGTHGWGNGVIVDHGTHQGDNLRTLYAHMYQRPPWSTGMPVSRGETLGGIGNTGNSFGAHLHLETHVNGVPINPRTFMATYGGE